MTDRNFLSLASERFSVRSFSDKPVESEKVETILKAAQIAPTACNRQPQRIYVLRTPDALDKLQKCKYSHFGETLAFLVCYDKTECWKREADGKESGETDAAIVATHMMLAAWDVGIGSTWIMHFIPEAVRNEFRLSENVIPKCILVMGYPSEKAVPSVMHGSSKELSDMVVFL